ncbi:lytic transglycosylase domain-containing protein [Oscillospiraceae bacterium PP1C4]
MGKRTSVKHARWRNLLLELLLLVVVMLGAVKAVQFGLDRYYRNAYPMQYSALVDAACQKNNLDRAFVYALIRTESGFDPNAVSNVGARGLMQLMPDAFDWVRMRSGEESTTDYDQLFDPEINITYGTGMLRILFDEFETGDNVLCAYHAGWGSVKKWLANPEYAPDGENIAEIPFPDTAHYVSKVNKAAAIYRKLYDL